MEMLSKTPDLYLEYLLKSRIFSGLTANEIEDFLNNSPHDFIHLNAHSELTVNLGNAIIILSGTLATYELNDKGKRTFISLFPAEGNPLIPISRTYSYPNMAIFAKTESLVLLLDTESCTGEKPSLLVLQNKVQQNIINLLYDGTICVVSRALCNTEPQARDRIIKYLGDIYQRESKTILNISSTRDEFANYLQMDTSTLMRELKKLKNEGIIDYDRNSIIIKRVDIFN